VKIKLIRDTFTEKSTIGKLFINDIYECNTLEDFVRKGKKIYGKTAIPEGVYPVIIDWSNKYQRNMPHILNVPEFSGIRIHSGNDSDDTEGCIILGMNRKIDWVGQSRTAYTAFFSKLNAAFEHEEKITIEVTHEKVAK
jgi:hypothetical protein